MIGERERESERERERESESERERERAVYPTSQTILRHDSQDEGVSRRRSGAEVHGNNSRKIMKKKETVLTRRGMRRKACGRLADCLFKR